MPNEVARLLNTLNSYVTCPTCKVTNDIEIILKCGHVICKDCKTKRTKCPSCFTDLSATREHSPSVKFIEDLRQEFFKESADSSLNDFVEQAAVLGKNISSKEVSNRFHSIENSNEDFTGKYSYIEVGKKNIAGPSQLSVGRVNGSVKQAKDLERNSPSETVSALRNDKITNYKVVNRNAVDGPSTPLTGNLVKNYIETKADKGISIRKEKNRGPTENEIRKLSRLNEEVKKSNVQKENIETDKNVIIIGGSKNEISENHWKKHDKTKKKVVFYGNYSKQKESEVHQKILNELGIAGIDKQVQNVSKRCVNASEIEWNGHLNSIISRLNSQNPTDSSLLTDEDSSALIQETSENSNLTRKMNNINSFKVANTVDMKRKCNDDLGCSSHLVTNKRKKVDGNEMSNHNISLKSVDIVNNKISTRGSPKNDKKLGGIVDEDEIVKRYLNATKKRDFANYNMRDETDRLNDFDIAGNSQSSSSRLEDPDLLTDLSKSVNNINNMKSVNSSKSDVIAIVSELLSEQNQSLEEDELERDIMVDMLNNVSNEIIIVGSRLCSTEKPNTAECDRLVNVTNDVSNCEYLKENEILIKASTENHFPNVQNHLNEEKSKTQNNRDIIVVSDSDDEIELSNKNKKIDLSKTKVNQTVIQADKDINIKNCKVVIENFAPLMFQSVGNSIRLNCTEEKQSKSVLKKSPESGVSSGKTLMKKSKIHLENKKNNDTTITAKQKKVPLKQSKDKCNEALNFEGFTEQDILILTVKLALFKMNGCKYSNNLSTSSLFTLDGKQILIKDMSRAEGFIGGTSGENRSCKALVSSSVQTENDILTETPSPSTSRIRPVSIAKLRGLERVSEKFMQNDILDTSEPITPLISSIDREAVSPNSPVQRVTPVSRRQLSFMSPPFEYNSQFENSDVMASSSKNLDSMPSSSSNEDWQVLHYRMQYMMPSYTEEISHNECSGIRPTRLTFTTCSLNSKETALVTKLARMTNCCLTKDFTHDTTHLIIGASGRGTLEYYLAIAYRAFIVTMEWVTLCIALNKILPVTGFIPTEDEGPLKCLEPISPPFVGFYICSKILPSASNYPIAEITKTLLSLGGARMLADIDAFQNLQDGNYPRFFVFGANTQITQSLIDKCASMHVVPVQFMWVYESISSFRALPVMDYLGTVIHSRTLIRDYRIPEQLACSRYPRLEGLCQRDSYKSSFSEELSGLNEYLAKGTIMGRL